LLRIISENKLSLQIIGIFDMNFNFIGQKQFLMDILDLHKRTNIKPASGKLLIAEPFLTDPGFARTVVFLCEHGEDGSVGFVLNRPSVNNIGDLLPELHSPDLTIFEGGPVQNDTLHMIHRLPDVMGGVEIMPGIFWGGSYTDLSRMIQSHACSPENIRLFIGYSGWGKGQLEEELKEGSWLVADMFEDVIFESDTSKVWKDSIHSLGSNFAHLANLPIHPQLN
jgi:putative transcriptional regulator